MWNLALETDLDRIAWDNCFPHVHYNKLRREKKDDVVDNCKHRSV